MRPTIDGALEHALRVGGEPVDARRDQRLQRVGDTPARPLAPCSTSMRIVSSTNSGLPSVFSSAARGRRTRAAVAVARRARRRARSLSSARAARARSRSRAGGRRPSRGARRAARAGRARRSAAARSLTHVARCSISSSSGSSAQWMSSKTSTSGCGAPASRPTRARPTRSPAGSARPRPPRARRTRARAGRRPPRPGSSRAASPRPVERIVVGDPGRGLDHLGERPVRDALAVRERAAARATVAPPRSRRTPDEAASCRCPGSPKTVKSCARRSRTARAYVFSSRSSSALAADERRSSGRRGAVVGDAGRRARPRPARRGRAPRAGRESSSSSFPIVSRCAPGPITILPGSRGLLQPGGDVDRLARRERRVGSSTTTSPDSMPMRASSPSSLTASRTPNAARTARSASSSCATGMPNAAMTASPANFSTMPPCWVTHCETCSKYCAMRRRTTSGSAPETRAVEPTRSTNRTVASLRSTLTSVETPPISGRDSSFCSRNFRSAAVEWSRAGA